MIKQMQMSCKNNLSKVAQFQKAKCHQQTDFDYSKTLSLKTVHKHDPFIPGFNKHIYSAVLLQAERQMTKCDDWSDQD